MSTYTIKGYAYYAKVHKPDVPENAKWEPKYKMCLVPVDEAEAERAQALGMQLKPTKTDKIPSAFLDASKRFVNAAGEEQPPIPVVDADLVPFKDLIGNGSLVNVSVYFDRSKDMKNPHLLAVQVLDLVQVNTGGVGAFGKVDGFVAVDAEPAPVSESAEGVFTEAVSEDAFDAVIDADFDENNGEGLL